MPFTQRRPIGPVLRRLEGPSRRANGFVSVFMKCCTKSANVEPFHPGPPSQHAVLAKTAALLGIAGTLQVQ